MTAYAKSLNRLPRTGSTGRSDATRSLRTLAAAIGDESAADVLRMAADELEGGARESASGMLGWLIEADPELLGRFDRAILEVL